MQAYFFSNDYEDGLYNHTPFLIIEMHPRTISTFSLELCTGLYETHE